MKGAKLITFDPRLSNTASMSDVWLPTWPGSEATVLLAIANYLIQNDRYDRDVRAPLGELGGDAGGRRRRPAGRGDVDLRLRSLPEPPTFDDFSTGS